MTETDLANFALTEIGGAGDQANANGLIDDIDDVDRISSYCRTLLPVCRKTAITDLATAKCPPREATRYADLGNQIAAGNLPEIGGWSYAFVLPSNCLAVSRQIDHDFTTTTGPRQEYRFETIANKDGTGLIFLTNDLTNIDNTSAFIEYVIDVPVSSIFSMPLTNCITLLLGSKLCTPIGKDLKLMASLLQEYEQLAKPNAAAFNRSQLNNSAKTTYDYLGGRNNPILISQGTSG
jgi:hypothetical protein